MKTPSDDLFVLIKSLSPAEKRYFKIFSTIHSGRANKLSNKKYIILFNAIDHLTRYDEKKLKANLKDVTLKSNLKTFKSYVSEAILNSLEKYYQNTTKQLQVHHLLTKAHILYSKRLFLQCEKVLRKAEVIAGVDELFPELISILFLKINIARATDQYENVFYKNGDIERMRFVFDLLNNYSEYYFLGVSSEYILKKNSQIRKGKDQGPYNEILTNDLLLNSAKAKSETAKKIYFNLKSRFLMMIGERQKAYGVILECDKFYKSKSKLVKMDITYYSIALYNKAAIEFSTGKAKSAFQTIEDCQKLIEKYTYQLDESELTLGYDILYTLKIKHCIQIGNFQTARKYLDEFENSRYYEKLKNSSNKAHLFFGAIISFGLGNYRKSIEYLNKILLFSNTDFRSDIIIQSKILFIIMQYELNHTDLLPYLIRSIYRYLLKRERLYKFEDAILQFLRKELPKANNKPELINAFIKLLNKIKKLRKDAFEKNVLGDFDFISWLESKIQNRSFAVLIREKAVLKKLL